PMDLSTSFTDNPPSSTESESPASKSLEKVAAHYAAIKKRFWYKCKLCQMPFEKTAALEKHEQKCKLAYDHLQKTKEQVALKQTSSELRARRSSSEMCHICGVEAVEALEPACKKPKSPENPSE